MSHLITCNFLLFLLPPFPVSRQIETLKNELIKKQEDMRETQTRADTQLLENRAYLDRKEREHEKEVAKLEAELERHLRHHSDLIGKVIKRKAEITLSDVSTFRWEM